MIECTCAFKTLDQGEIYPVAKQVITALARGWTLAERYYDHALTGNWKLYRDCHIRPDPVLIYRLIGNDR